MDPDIERILRQTDDLLDLLGMRARGEVTEAQFWAVKIERERRLEQPYLNYAEAMRRKAAGDLKGAVELLRRSVDPPSIYRGHYRELFKIYRIWNREAAKAARWQEIIDRVLTMAELDEELVTALAARRAQYDDGANRLITDFDEARNLTATDAKQLLKAAKASGQHELAAKAQELVRVVEARR